MKNENCFFSLPSVDSRNYDFYNKLLLTIVMLLLKYTKFSSLFFSYWFCVLILIWFSLHIYILFKISDKLWIYESKTNSVAETNETNGINFKSPNQKQEKVKWKEKWEKCDFGCWKPTLAYFLLQAIWVFTFFHSIEVEFIARNKTKHLKQLSFVFQAHSIVSTYWLYKRVWFKGWK